MLARLQAFRFSLFLALTAALCVVGNVALVSAQRTAQPSGRPVEATASSALAASTTIAPVSSAAFQETNGNKVIPGAGAIHAVFTDANSVKYTKTVDGVNWSPPVTIEANANHPTIAVAGTTIGIAYVASTGFIRYTYKSQTGTARHAPINVYASGVSRDPTMVSYNSKMYLAWALSDTYVFYASFPPAITTAPTSQQANFSPLCFGYSSILFQPSIAVSATSATDPQPLIRVAYFKSETASSSCGPYSNFGYEVNELHPSTGYLSNLVSSLFPSSGSVPPHMSISLAANPANGDFYLGVSYGPNGSENTQLWYQNAWNTSNPWRLFSVLPRKAHIDVEANCGMFRVAVSDFTQGAGGYGPTWYRTGTWTGQAATSPTWDEPTNVTVSNAGAHPQALFLSTHTGNIVHGTSHLISTAFDDLAGSSHSVRHDDRSFNGPSLLTGCLQTKSTTNTKAF